MQSWHDFFLVAGPAAASLVGLLFVGLSLHLRAVIARSEVRGLARVTFANFALVLVVALFFVIPQDAPSLGEQLIGAAVVSLLIAAPAIVTAARSRTRTLDARQLVLRFGSSALAYLAVGVAGGLVAAGADKAGLVWLAAATIALLVISLRNSWDLLVSVGAAVVAAERDDAAAAAAETS